MSTRYISFSDTTLAEEAVAELKKDMPRPRHALYIYITDEESRLSGIISLRDLLFADGKEKLMELAKSDIIHVSANTSIDDIFNLMSKYELLAIPVLDKAGKLIGVIRLHDIFHMIVPEKTKRERIVKFKKNLCLDWN